jgi:hypothetical protein
MTELVLIRDEKIEQKEEAGVYLSEVDGIVTEILENKQSSIQEKAKFPPEKFPLMWYIGFDNDKFGNMLADDMLNVAEHSWQREVRAENYLGVKGRYLHLYFKGIDAFRKFAAQFIDDKPVIVEDDQTYEIRELYLKDFESQAIKVLKKIAIKSH